MTSPAIIFDRVSFAYPGGSPALENVSLSVEPGQVLAVIGPNGGGKSTLLKLMLGMLQGYSGRIEVCGSTPSAARERGLIGYVPQRSEAELSFPISVRQAVSMSAARSLPGWKPTTRAIKDRVMQCLTRVGAAAYADRPVGELSGGQWQRVMIARALAVEPRVLALDEPMVGIDAPGQKLFAGLLSELRRDLGLTIVLVSHDLRTVAGASSACDRVACLRRTLHFHAAPNGVTPQVLAEVFQHDLADIFGEVHVDAHKAADCGHDHSEHTQTPHAHD